MADRIDLEGINSLDTKKLIEAHELVDDTLKEILEKLEEMKELQTEQKDLLTEIKVALQGN